MIKHLNPLYRPENVFQRDQLYYNQLRSRNQKTKERMTSPFAGKGSYKPERQGEKRGISLSGRYHKNPFMLIQDPGLLQQKQEKKKSRSVDTNKSEWNRLLFENMMLKRKIQKLTQGISSNHPQIVSQRTQISSSSSETPQTHRLNWYSQKVQLDQVNKQESRILQLSRRVQRNKKKVDKYESTFQVLRKQVKKVMEVDKSIYTHLTQPQQSQYSCVLEAAQQALRKGESVEYISSIFKRLYEYF